MNKTSKKPVIGILGGVCSGKSTVAAEFAKLGCVVIDADEIGHELLNNAELKKTVIEAFGGGILNPSGLINRDKLARIVFSDAAKINCLNKILHPEILVRIQRLIEQYQSQSDVKAIVLDAPLLVEAAFQDRCDSLVFVACNKQKRTERAKKLKKIDENQLKIRENFQISLDIKRNIAEYTLDNNAGISEIASQVVYIFSKLIDK